MVQNTRTVVVSVSHGAGLSSTYAYSGEIDVSRAVAVKIRAVVTAGGGGGTPVLLSLMDASDSANTTVDDDTSGTYDGLLSTRQSSGSAAVEHSIAAGRAVLACNVGGLVGKLALRYKTNAASAAGDALVAEVTISEES